MTVKEQSLKEIGGKEGEKNTIIPVLSHCEEDSRVLIKECSL